MLLGDGLELSQKRSYDQAFEHFSQVKEVVGQRYLRGARLDNEPEPSPGDSSSVLGLASTDDTKRICCFGSLDNISIRLRSGSPYPWSRLGETRSTIGGSTYLVFRINWIQGFGQVATLDNSWIALLNSKTSAQLSGISQMDSLSVEGVLPTSLLEPMCSAQGLIDAGLILRVSLNLYGNLELGDMVAQELSRNRLYLQDPVAIKEDVTYDNPQLLKFTYHNLERSDMSSVLQHGIEDSCEGDTDEENETSDLNEALEQAANGNGLALNALVEHFSQHHNLCQAHVNSYIRTQLLPHQREGLDFLLKRESQQTNGLDSLWEVSDTQSTDLCASEQEKTIYRHRISGLQSTDATDIHGGILADDMGLGKSLVVIAAVATSLVAARQYAFTMTIPPGQGRISIIAARSTVIIVPSVLLIDTWVQEMHRHTMPGSLSYYVYHGQRRKASLSHMLNHDILLTTYGTLAMEYKRKQGLLFTTQWYRLVLDEAHVIRNAATVQFRAVSSLSSHIRWCLTGTPIQNSLDDLGSLISFLQLPILKEAAQFRRYITRKTNATIRYRRADLRNLKLLVGSICLRRLKSILSFARPEEHIHWVKFSVAETKGYRRTERAWNDAIQLAVNGHKSKTVHRTILEALLRMRMYCNNTNHSVDAKPGQCGALDEIGSILQQTGAAICHYCSCDVSSFGPITDSNCGIITMCERAICEDCMDRYGQELNDLVRCPLCHQRHSQPAITSGNSPDLTLSPLAGIPSKIQVLCHNLQAHRHESKSVVFSFWKKSLDIAGQALDCFGIPYIRVDGSMIPSQRKIALSKFETAETGAVLLMTLGTGAVGLNNLVVANHVHILEPRWNPFVEQQAIGRIARLGQTQTVHVMRYIVENTVEGMVHNGQLRKLNLATSGFGHGEAMSKQSKTELLAKLICRVDSDSAGQ